MAYIEQPGFLDTLIGQGLQTFQQFRGYRDQRRDKKRADERAEQQDAFQQFKLASDVGDVNQAQSALNNLAKFAPGLKGVKLSEDDRMFKDRVRKMPDEDLDISPFQVPGGLPTGPIKIKGKKSLSDEDKTRAGLPTELDLKKRKLDTATVDSALANLPATQQAERLRAIQPILEDASSRFIAGPIIKAFADPKTRGRIDPSKLDALAEGAMQQFVGEQQGKAEGGLTPADVDQARSYFRRAALDEFRRQQDQDIKRLAALPSSSFGGNPAQMVNALNGLARTKQDDAQTAQRAAEGMLKNDTFLGMALALPPGSRNTEMQAKVDAYNTKLSEAQALNQQSNQLQSAASAHGAGMIGTDEAQQYLRGFISQATPGGPGQGPTPLPIGGANIRKETSDAQAAIAQAKTPAAKARIRAAFKQRTGQDLP